MDLQAIKTEPEEFRKNPYPVCRLCLSEGELADVFDEEGLNQLVLDLLSITVYLDDPISQSVCGVCRIRIFEFYQFRTRCQEVQTVLQSWLQSTIQQEATNLEQVKRNQSSEICNAETNPLQCEVCQKLFKKRKLLICHRNIHRPRKHTCTICSKLFARRQQLLRHMTLVHPKEPGTTDNTIFESREEIVAVINVSEQKQQTKYNAEAQNEESLQDTKGGVTSEIYYEPTSSSHAADGKGMNIERNELQCDICFKMFKLRQTMRAHRKNIHGIKNLICPICERPFALRFSLERHILSHQSVEERQRSAPDIARSFKCVTCDKTFKGNSGLLQHQKKVHGPRCHECHICNFRFTMRNKLEQHIKVHTRDRDSKEDFRLFQTQQMQPKEAFSTVNADVEGEPKSMNIGNEYKQNTASDPASLIECEKCQKTFKTQKSLWLHYKFTHKPKKFKCSICSEFFASNKKLEEHILTKHNQEDSTLKSQKCPFCDKVFLSVGQLNSHVLNHGPRKHCCTVCSKTFTKLRNLKKHMKCHVDSKDDNISQETQNAYTSEFPQPSESQLAENSSEYQSSLKEGDSLFEAEEFKIEPE
ncbi:zinc finger protein Xfin isoform X2 [Aedes albopictus]|uniref:C2h2-type zn-finger protein n=1 Tax=Aedes albopictus TaxID=7160 RepID=A0ABM1XM67_AEDAL|nr:zinc finger protein Xfin isoform X2 [Aedes albopictus]